MANEQNKRLEAMFEKENFRLLFSARLENENQYVAGLKNSSVFIKDGYEVIMVPKFTKKNGIFYCEVYGRKKNKK